MCLDSLMGGSSKSQRNLAIWQAQRDEMVRNEQRAEQARQYAENEAQRVAAQAQMDARYQAQIERENKIIEEQRAAAAGAADAARAQEAARVAQIQQSRGAIEGAFSGFNDDYFSGAATKYAGAYLPRLEEDRIKSADKLKAALAGRGTLESSVGINAFADLDKRAADERAAIAARGSEFAESLRAKVNQAKGNLFESATAGGDPSQWASRATGEATNILNFGDIIPAGPANAYGSTYYSPQGGTTTVPGAQNSSVFGAVLAPLVTAGTAALNAPKTSKSTSMAAPITGSGTAKVVG